MCFKVCYIIMTPAITFLQDFKLGHYMKIPPRTMFTAQVVGTLIAGLVYLSTAWWLMDISLDLPYGHSFTMRLSSPHIGPRGISGDLGTYAAVNWFFLAGAIAPVLVWLAATAFPQQKWIRLINTLVLIIATGRWLLRLTTLSFLDHFGFSLVL